MDGPKLAFKGGKQQPAVACCGDPLHRMADIFMAEIKQFLGHRQLLLRRPEPNSASVALPPRDRAS